MCGHIFVYFTTVLTAVSLWHSGTCLTIKGFCFYHLGPVCTTAEASDSGEARNSSRQTAGDARAKLWPLWIFSSPNATLV